MKTGVSLWIRLVRLFGVLLSMSISVSALVMLPFTLFTWLWDVLYVKLSGRIPVLSTPGPEVMPLPGALQSLSIGGGWMARPPTFPAMVETSLFLVSVICATLILTNSLLPMKARIKNASGLTPSRLPAKHFAVQVVNELRDRSGGPSPSVWIIPVDGITAFALSGPLIGHGIVLSRGVLGHLSKDMVAWIIAHEYAHIRHGDTRSSSLWIVSMRSVYLLERVRIVLMNWILSIVRFLPILKFMVVPIFCLFRGLLLIGKLARFSGRMVFLLFDRWASRKMEYAADKYAALMIGSDIGAELFEGLMGDVEPLFNGLFATHPSLSDRAKRLRAMK